MFFYFVIILFSFSFSFYFISFFYFIHLFYYASIVPINNIVFYFINKITLILRVTPWLYIYII
ncbi:hypothetical protein PFFVO_01650 [Plasmodium falciparum Vietnam Oak-Knoll (FVO)]|uniref:Uncharacterized protein n=1 Tax=Plasmodium falciparum Vietnam Oak-Knoll (FVO) TaxID=1036723 RepID=A0A024VAG4_PLAFA|nr:hypothetical protein PFFVO_01650 [Plasmodium falciparum Vietnam Oak-Knoll (FVO)]